MGTSAQKHARQKAGRQARLSQARRQVAAQSRRRKVVSGIGILLGVAVIVGGLLLLVQDGEQASEDTTTTTTSSASTTTSEAPAAELPSPPEGVTLDQETPCPPAQGSAKRVQSFAGPPPTCIDPDAAYTATFNTTAGSFTAELDAERAPVSVNNFVVLARYHYYDGVPFHRIVPGFVIQAGDGDGPDEAGNWGNNDSLGYTVPDELPSGPSDYRDFSLAMANAGPDTNGSQFFVVLPGGGKQLDPANYSLFGQVTEGTDVVEKIGSLDGAEDKPSEAVVIESVEITETPR